MDELKSCPFCGMAAKIGNKEIRGEKKVFVYCTHCWSESPFASNDQREFVTKLWNNRAPIKLEINEEVLRKALEKLLKPANYFPKTA